MKKVIFTKEVRVCTGLFWYRIAAGTIGTVVKRYGLDAAEITCRNVHGEVVQFVQTFIGAASPLGDCRWYDEGKEVA